MTMLIALSSRAGAPGALVLTLRGLAQRAAGEFDRKNSTCRLGRPMLRRRGASQSATHARVRVACKAGSRPRAPVYRAKSLDHAGERFSARIVLMLILGSTALSLYDAHLLRGLLVP